MYKFFVPTPKTVEELKKMYHKLAMQYHPDMGGSKEDMQQINAEYEILFSRLKNVHQSAEDPNETYTAQTSTSESAYDFIEIINKLIHIPDIVIELCGRWIWISGNTYNARADLKAAGCAYASKKKMWYWHYPEDSSNNRKNMSMEKIRELHGSEILLKTHTAYALT